MLLEKIKKQCKKQGLEVITETIEIIREKGEDKTLFIVHPVVKTVQVCFVGKGKGFVVGDKYKEICDHFKAKGYEFADVDGNKFEYE
jgi:hypothetical protein